MEVRYWSASIGLFTFSFRPSCVRMVATENKQYWTHTPRMPEQSKSVVEIWIITVAIPRGTGGYDLTNGWVWRHIRPARRLTIQVRVA